MYWMKGKQKPWPYGGLWRRTADSGPRGNSEVGDLFGVACDGAGESV